MPATDVQFQGEDARLVFLAVAYHLGRPGSELDPVTKQPVEHGLAEVAARLQPQLSGESATINLRPNQARRLTSGMLGTISELKTYNMLQPRPDHAGNLRRSSVPGFDRSLLHLFPEVEESTGVTLDIAERMLMLKRRLDGELAELLAEPEPEEGTAAPEAPRRRGWWPFGKRS